jgi:glycosyltransferase involved in cell wall biosynthesis
MLAQTILPKRWIIIDDGSTDRTRALIAAAAAKSPWIEPYNLPKRTKREAGGEAAVKHVLSQTSWDNCGYLMRLDADVTFGPEYASLLLAEFRKDRLLGIAGGSIYEKPRGRWRLVEAPSFDTPGASKFYSRSCYEAIGGLEGDLGWDTIDDMRALMRGYRTKRFGHIHVFHHRVMGSSRGLWRGRLRAGEAAYNVGYLPLFMLARAAYRTFDEPWIAGALLLLIGYLRPWLTHRRPLAEPELIRFVRAQQWRRLTLSETLWR